MKLDYRGPAEYIPGRGTYLEDHECEPNHYFKESRRTCDLDLRWDALQRDSLRCRRCGVAVTAFSAQVDHIIPVNRFASFRQAQTLDNLQTLCPVCHDTKTREEGRSQ